MCMSDEESERRRSLNRPSFLTNPGLDDAEMSKFYFLHEILKVFACFLYYLISYMNAFLLCVHTYTYTYVLTTDFGLC